MDFLVIRTPSDSWEKGRIAHHDMVILEGDGASLEQGIEKGRRHSWALGSWHPGRRERMCPRQDTCVGGKAGPGPSTQHSLF